MAGLDGIKNKVDPKENGFGPYDVNVYELPESEKKKLKLPPDTFMQALGLLKENHDFLLEGDVFSEELI